MIKRSQRSVNWPSTFFTGRPWRVRYRSAGTPCRGVLDAAGGALSKPLTHEISPSSRTSAPLSLARGRRLSSWNPKTLRGLHRLTVALPPVSAGLALDPEFAVTVELLLCQEAMRSLDNRVKQVRAYRADPRNLLEFWGLRVVPVGPSEFNQFSSSFLLLILGLVGKLGGSRPKCGCDRGRAPPGRWRSTRSCCRRRSIEFVRVLTA
jgi:hypothetical protein